MEKNTRNIIITVVIILLVGCIIVTAAVCIGTSLFFTRLNVPASNTPTLVPITPLPTIESESNLDQQTLEQMDIIQAQIISMRGLKPSSAVPRTLLTADELRQNVINDFLSEYTVEEAAEDARVLNMIGLLEPDFDLIGFYTELYSEQIAGYYDDEIKAMFVVQEKGFTGAEKSTYAHEYTHVLQDQAFDFDGVLGYTEEACEEDSERCAAIQALIEGDAVVTELNWLENYASMQDLKDLSEFYSDYESPVYDSAPHYMKSDFMFPYEKGKEFVDNLMKQGGYLAVDEAYINVPVSTEQILHPEKYPNEVPVPVDLPDFAPKIGAGWQELDRNLMGEWYTYLILAHGYDSGTRLDEQEALTASAGWGGDIYLVYQNPGTNQYAFIMRSSWDSNLDMLEFRQALIDHADLRWGDSYIDELGFQVWQADGGFSAIIEDNGLVTWIIAPDQATYQSIITNLP